MMIVVMIDDVHHHDGESMRSNENDKGAKRNRGTTRMRGGGRGTRRIR